MPKRPRNEMLTFQMTRQQALEMNLLTCSCRHPENNHFDHGEQPCAHCECPGFDERPRVGKLL